MIRSDEYESERRVKVMVRMSVLEGLKTVDDMGVHLVCNVAHD